MRKYIGLLKRTGFVICSSLLLASCFDVEEVFDINQDNSGTYRLQIDLGRTMAFFKMIGKSTDSSEVRSRDTSIYFRDLFVDDTSLTAEERALFKDAKSTIKMSEADGVMKINTECPFATMDKLTLVKSSMNSVVRRLGVMEKLEGKPKREAATDDDSGEQRMAKDIFGSGAGFTAGNGFLKFVNLAKPQSMDLGAGEDAKGLNQLMEIMGDASYAVVVRSVKPIKSATGDNVVLAADKGSARMSWTFKTMMESPDKMNYTFTF